MIRANLLSSKWPKVRLGDVVEFLDHKRKPITAKDRVPGPYPYYGANGQQDSVDDYIFDESLVLVAEDGGYFGDPNRTIAYQVEGKCWVNNHAHVLRPTPKIDIRYLCRHLEKYDVRPYINGATREKLNKGMAQEITISLPPLAEQKHIAAILDKADAIRRKRQQAINLTDQLLRSVFLEMFGDPVRNPKEWPIQEIETVCEEIVDCVNRTAPSVDRVTPFKMIRTTNIRNYQINTENVRYVEEDVYKKWVRRLTPKQGDIIFTREAPSGEAAIVKTEEKIFLGQRTMHFRPDYALATPEYLLHELMGVEIKRQIKKMSAGSTVTHLSVPECKKFKVRVPPIDGQKRFSNIENFCLLRGINWWVH